MSAPTNVSVHVHAYVSVYWMCVCILNACLSIYICTFVLVFTFFVSAYHALKCFLFHTLFKSRASSFRAVQAQVMTDSEVYVTGLPWQQCKQLDWLHARVDLRAHEGLLTVQPNSGKYLQIEKKPHCLLNIAKLIIYKDKFGSKLENKMCCNFCLNLTQLETLFRWSLNSVKHVILHEICANFKMYLLSARERH